ncbi:hypothetical protein DRE_03323 [Drechslerella stenobrocha 248]|uniref:Monopolin complex subunit Csm1/Pcs1 C-terminal domain-containing protein n=1 Tax=Drechslerella stenobrocha 248 TaxID=1043628 RepID=W7HUM2_9PEZI|nr:hypothetical protein DRE_03323 [Drechslerella stenobrocha 248]
MPPKKPASQPTLASRLASSPSSSDNEPVPIAAASRKARGRPRKQAPSTSKPVDDSQDDIEPAPPPPKAKPSTRNPTKHKAGQTAEPITQPVAPVSPKRKKPEAHRSRGAPAKIEADPDLIPPEEGVPPPKRRATNSVKAAPTQRKTRGAQLEIPETQAACTSPDEDDEELEEGSLGRPSSRDIIPGDNLDAVKSELGQLKARYEKLRHLKTDVADSIHKEHIEALREQDKASQRIIESLKAELAATSSSYDAIQQKDARLQQLEQENSIMEKKIERLVQDHAILSAKLETARNQTRTSAVAKAAGTASFIKELSQHRDNLYSDLCGLIVVNVKTDEDGGIEYDCLSTGKNGALHFKLQLDAEDEEDDDDDGPYFTYNPMLERGRDERMLAVLPPIFRDEMNFKRTRGVDFYLQLMQSLQSS